MKYLYIIFLMVVGISMVHGKTYYLDPVNGDNSNVGSMTSPWFTLESVLDANMIETQSYQPLPYTDQSTLVPKNVGAPIKAGDTLRLMSGFHGYAYYRGASNVSYITIMPAEGAVPVLEGVKLTSVSRWRLIGLTITTESTGAYHTGRLCFIESHGYHGPSSFVTIDQCTVQSVEDASTWTLDDWLNKSASGIYTNASHITITNNTIRNVDHGISILAGDGFISNNAVVNFSGDGLRPLGSNHIVQYNLVKNCYDVDDNHDDGLQVFTSEDHPIENLVIRGNMILNFEDFNQPFRGPLQGIGCFDGPFINWVIENNIVVVDHWHGITLMGAFNCDIVNNTVIDPTPDERPGPCWIRVTDHKNGTPSEGCRVINNLTNTLSLDALDLNNILVGGDEYDDHFVDFGGLDLHLLGSSSAIDAGDTTAAPTEDYDGLQRPQGTAYDVGAYEYEYITTSVADLDQPRLKVFPNPAYKEVKIEWGWPNHGELRLEVRTLSGRMVDNLPYCDGMEWGTSEYGMYLFVLKEGERVLASRLVTFQG